MKSYKKTYIVQPYGVKATIAFCDDNNIYELAKLFGVDEPSFKDWDGGMIEGKILPKYGTLILFGSETTIGDIAHECNHMMNTIMSHIGNPSNRINDEPDCYLLGWLVDRVVECRITFDKMK